MRCTRLKRRLEAYLTNEIGERERAKLEQHLAECASCNRALERARQLRALFADARTPGLPTGFHMRVMARAREEAAEPAQNRLLGRVFGFPAMPAPLRVAATVAVFMALGTGVLIGRDMWRPAKPSPSEQARESAVDPVRVYRIDYLGEAPQDSLARAYVGLLSAEGGG